MAWTAPTTWVAGTLVDEADLNTQLRDNLLHVAGTNGFTATSSATRGIEPLSGYFAGSVLQDYRLEGGSFSVGIGVTTSVSFSTAFAAAPVVVFTAHDNNYGVTLLSIGTTGFTIYGSILTTGRWLAWGSDV